MNRLTIACALVLTLGCDAISVGPGAPTAPEAPRAEPGAEEPAIDERACGELTRHACLRAVHCTLTLADERPGATYACREARGNCEIGLRQMHADRDRCADRVGCAWADGSCYCACRSAAGAAAPDGDEAEPCDCGCRGGPPPGCRGR